MNNPLQYKFTVEIAHDEKFEDPTVRVVFRDDGMEKNTRDKFLHYLNMYLITKELQTPEDEHERKVFYYSPIPEKFSEKGKADIKFYIKNMNDMHDIIQQFPPNTQLRPYLRQDIYPHAAGGTPVFHNAKEFLDVVNYELENATNHISKIRDKKDRFLVADMEFNDLPDVIQFGKASTSHKFMPYHITLKATRENKNLFGLSGRMKAINSFVNYENEVIQGNVVKDFHAITSEMSKISDHGKRMEFYNKSSEELNSAYFVGRVFSNLAIPAIHFATNKISKAQEFFDLVRDNGKAVFRDVTFTYDGRLMDLSLKHTSPENQAKLAENVEVDFERLAEIKKQELLTTDVKPKTKLR